MVLKKTKLGESIIMLGLQAFLNRTHQGQLILTQNNLLVTEVDKSKWSSNVLQTLVVKMQFAVLFVIVNVYVYNRKK